VEAVEGRKAVLEQRAKDEEERLEKEAFVAELRRKAEEAGSDNENDGE
jgi:hypothetical protein